MRYVVKHFHQGLFHGFDFDTTMLRIGAMNMTLHGVEKAYFLRSAKQTTGIASINKTQINAFPMLLPPPELQKQFEERLNGLEARLGTYKNANIQLENLFASLQHRAFKGEL